MDNEKDTNLSEVTPSENAQELIDLTETDTSQNSGSTEDFTEDPTAAEATAADTTEEVTTSETETAPQPTMWETAPPPEKRRLNGQRLSKLILFCMSLVLLIGSAAATLYYIVYAGSAEFHADCTDTIMWANASVESGHLYDSEFTYACFLPFSTSTLMIPLIKIFGLCMTAHIGGMLCFFILLTFFMLLMIREITGSTPAGFFGTALFLSITLVTPKLREIFWGHTIYYSLGILFLVIGAFLYSRLLSVGSREIKLRKEGRNTKGASLHKLLIFLCLCIFMLLTGMDGITGFTLFALPFAGAIFIEQFINKKYSILSGRTALVTFRAVFFIRTLTCAFLIELQENSTAVVCEGGKCVKWNRPY